MKPGDTFAVVADYAILCLLVIMLTVPGPNGEPMSGGMSMMLMMMGWLVVATALYLLRPNSLRDRGDTKPSRPAVILH